MERSGMGRASGRERERRSDQGWGERGAARESDAIDEAVSLVIGLAATGPCAPADISSRFRGKKLFVCCAGNYVCAHECVSSTPSEMSVCVCVCVCVSCVLWCGFVCVCVCVCVCHVQHVQAKVQQ